MTAFSFDEATFETFKSKGMLFQGHGILVKKAVLTYTPSTGISQMVKATAADAGGAIYNLQGQRIQSPQPGLYIKNGKKIVMR